MSGCTSPSATITSTITSRWGISPCTRTTSIISTLTFQVTLPAKLIRTRIGTKHWFRNTRTIQTSITGTGIDSAARTSRVFATRDYFLEILARVKAA